jgi:carbamoyltransferase
MLILGLSPFKHDPSAVLLEDGKVKAAAENDKLVRSRSRGLPDAAIRFCLKSTATTWGDIDVVAVASRPWYASLRRSLMRAKMSPVAPAACIYYEAKEIGELARELDNLRHLGPKNGACFEIRSFDHHLCHAAAAFLQSPFERSLIVTLDENGDGSAGLVAIGEGTRLRCLERINFPHSLAWVYTQITQLLGFQQRREEHKTQWLSLEGEPIHKDLFLEMLRGPRTCLPRLNYRFLRSLTTKLSFSPEFYRRIGASDWESELGGDLRRALASSMQVAFGELIADLVLHFSKIAGTNAVCFAGGLFQNALLVSDLEERLGDRLFVPPAPANPSSAIGAALFAWHSLTKKPRTEPPYSVFYGPSFDRQEIKDILDNSKARYSIPNTEQRKIDATVQLLESGRIVGWYQGAVEFGSRALGNRSLLASPWAPYVKENLNDYIKHRESFRPFAVAVPEEDCSRYFNASRLCYFMNSLARLRSDCNLLPPTFCLPGGRVRLQIVERRSNPVFWNLLKRFGERAPAPMLLNTSFNLFGEPLVVTPRDALRSYFSSGVDALVMNNFVLSKTSVRQSPAAVRAEAEPAALQA